MGTTDERLDGEECIRRLKRWYIGGAIAYNEGTWPVAQKRTSHLKYGGYRLSELASDNPVGNFFAALTDAELDEWCSEIPMPEQPQPLSVET